MSKFEDSYWTPLQVLAWVYLGDRELVSSFGSGDHADRWHEEEHVLFPDSTQTLAKVPARVPSRLRLDLKAAERGTAPLGGREAAEDDILLKISRAELMVTGIQNGAGAPREIPADHFCDLEIEWDDSKAVQKSRFRQGDVWTELRVKRDDILVIWADPLSETSPSTPSADAPGIATATLGDIVKDGAASRRSEPSEAPSGAASEPSFQKR